MAVRVGPLIISSCTSPLNAIDLLEERIAAIVAVDPSCAAPPGEDKQAGVPVIEFPLPPSGVRPVEELNELALIVKSITKGGYNVLVQGFGDFDSRAYLVASAVLAALNADVELPGPLTLTQDLAVAWYRRLVNEIGVEVVHQLYEIGKLYEFGAGIEHASTVANLSLDLATALGELLKPGGEELRALYAAGLLHDLGRFFAEYKHEETGIGILERHAGTLSAIVDLKLAMFLIKHHRRRSNPEQDPLYADFGRGGLLLAAILRLADSFTNVYGKEEYWGASLEADKLVVTARGVDRHRLESKGKLLEEVTGLSLELRHLY